MKKIFSLQNHDIFCAFLKDELSNSITKISEVKNSLKLLRDVSMMFATF
jgi:hypothetical protein